MNWRLYSIESLEKYFSDFEGANFPILITCKGDYSPYVYPAWYCKKEGVVLSWNREPLLHPVVSWSIWPAASIPGIDHA